MRRKCVLCVLVLVALLYSLTVLVELNHLSESLLSNHQGT